MIFAAYCPTHDARILLTRRNALSFWNGPDGPVIHWRCSCGHEGFLDRSGSHPEPPSESVDVAVDAGVTSPAAC